MSVLPAFLLFIFLSPYQVASQTYKNPVLFGDYPDPGVLYYEGVYYAMTTTTTNDTNRFPIHSSHNLVNWTFEGYVFPASVQSNWAVSDFWAPELHIIGGQFVVLYAARASNNMLSIGAAVGKSPTGPFTDIGHPLVQNTSLSGYIDPTYWYENSTDTGYLIWKEDGNDPAHYEPHTPIWAQPLTPSLTLTGQRVMLIENDAPWEGPLVEGPWVIKTNGYYYLFYSGNVYSTPNYAVGVARSTNFLGPYTKSSANPILHSNSAWSGPGHCSVVSVDNLGKTWVMVYHSWIANEIPGPGRSMLIDEVLWSADGWPSIRNSSPSTTPQPIPGN